MIIKDIEKTDMRRFGVLTQLNVPLWEKPSNYHLFQNGLV